MVTNIAPITRDNIDAATARTFFAAARAAMNASAFERREVIDLILIAFVAGEHVLLLGEPGVAKTQLAQNFCSMLESGSFFDYLLTRFTEPSEVMGPVNVAKLASTGDRELLTAGHLPEARVALLDELFKSNSALLNALLRIVNERRYFSGGAWHTASTECIIAASNEVPEEGDKSVAALFDRLLFRFLVPPIEDDANWEMMVTGNFAPTPGATIPDAAVVLARAESEVLPFDAGTLKAARAIFRELRSKGIVVSDRRTRQAMKALRAAAWLDGAATVSHGYVALLEHVCWDRPEQIPEVQAIVKKHAPAWDTELRAARAVIEQHMATVSAIAGMTTNAQRLEAVGAIQDAIDGVEGAPGLRADVESLAKKHPEARDGCASLTAAIDDLEKRAQAANIAARRAARKA